MYYKMSNNTFCADVGGCSARTCEDTVCLKDLVVRLYFDQGVAAALYIMFRLLEKGIWALIRQTNRELLQVPRKERCDKKYSQCCKKQMFDFTETCVGPLRKKMSCTCPTGIWKQMWLRFFVTLFGVFSFLLILEQNIIMFGAIVFLDVVFVGIRFRCQAKDHITAHDSFDIAWFGRDENYSNSDIDEKWLENFRKLVQMYKADSTAIEKNPLLLKFF